jgi:hypothetical protein
MDSPTRSRESWVQLCFSRKIWGSLIIFHSPRVRCGSRSHSTISSALTGAVTTLQFIARLKPGATVEQAQSQLAGIARHVEELNPEQSKDWSTSVNLIHEQVVGASRKTILILLGAVASSS